MPPCSQEWSNEWILSIAYILFFPILERTERRKSNLHFGHPSRADLSLNLHGLRPWKNTFGGVYVTVHAYIRTCICLTSPCIRLHVLQFILLKWYKPYMLYGRCNLLLILHKLK
jgi:hypothetical protein